MLLCMPYIVLSTTQRPVQASPRGTSARWWHLLADKHPPVLQRVTRIVGVDTYLLDPQLLAAALQRRFAASAGANPLPGAKAGGACEVVVQGDVAAKVWATSQAQSHARDTAVWHDRHLCLVSRPSPELVCARAALVVSFRATGALLCAGRRAAGRCVWGAEAAHIGQGCQEVTGACCCV